MHLLVVLTVFIYKTQSHLETCLVGVIPVTCIPTDIHKLFWIKRERLVPVRSGITICGVKVELTVGNVVTLLCELVLFFYRISCITNQANHSVVNIVTYIANLAINNSALFGRFTESFNARSLICLIALTEIESCELLTAIRMLVHNLVYKHRTF